jgi:type I restriction enzyme S subunit
MGATDEQAVLTGPFGTSLGRGDFIHAGIPLLTISCLTDQGIRMDKALFVSEAKAKDLERYRLKSGDLLFSRMASVGRAGIVGPDLEGALFNYHIMRLRLDESKLLPKFFTGYVRGAKQVRDYLLAVNHGATRDGINTEQLLAMPVIVAPLPEQRQIVAEIEKQFTRLEAGGGGVAAGSGQPQTLPRRHPQSRVRRPPRPHRSRTRQSRKSEGDI